MSQRIGQTGLATNRLWHHVSAENRTLGRLAVRIATVLQGKHKPTFDRSIDNGDYVVVTHCEKIFTTGKTALQKTYFKPSTYPGGSKKFAYQHVLARRPEDIITMAVSRMLPKNSFRFPRLHRLRVFQGDQNPYAQNITRRYDLSRDGSWEGKGSYPHKGRDGVSGDFERQRQYGDRL